MFHRDSAFLKIWMISFLIHVLGLFGFYFGKINNSEKLKIHLTKGTKISIFDRSIVPQNGKGKSKSDESNQTSGSNVLEREIDSFRNSLTYPELAVEQGLEDDCTFRVTVAENGQVEKLVVVAPCKYNVFDSQIKSQLRVWKFNVSKGKELVLPIRFRIHARE